NLLVFRGDSEYLSVGGAIIAHGANIVPLEHWRNRAQKLGFAADGKIVLIGKMVWLPGLIAALDRRDAARKNKHNVLPEIRQLFRLPAAKTFSQAYQQEQRTHAPG